MPFTYLPLLKWWLLVISSATARSTRATTDIRCSVYDGANGTPASIQRTCSVHPPGFDSCPEDQYCYKWTTYCQGVESISPEECPGFVGMDLTYRCSFEGAQLYRYKNGAYQYLNGSSVNYGLLLPEHAGLYECRNSTNHTVYAQNITVNEEIRIGASGRNCRHFSYSSNDTCCLSSNIWAVMDSKSYNFVVYAHPADNVSVTVEQLRWVFDDETRNDVDIGLYTEQDEQNPVVWRVKFKSSPIRVTDNEQKILFRITASNANFSHSICDHVKFIGPHFEGTFAVNNVTLPLSKTVQEHEDVTFQCTFSYENSAIHDLDFLVKLEFSTPVDNGTDRCITTLDSGNYRYNDDNCTLPPMATIEKQTMRSDSLTSVVEYTFRIPNASSQLTGSTFTCSLFSVIGFKLQWKKRATLTVIPARIHSTDDKGTDPSPASSAAPIAVSVIVISVIVTVVVFLSVGAAVILRRKRRGHTITPTDQVPLTSNSEHSSLCGSEANTPVIHMNRLPSFEITRSIGAQRNGIQVGNQAPNEDTNYFNLMSNTEDITEFPFGPSKIDHPKTLQLLRDPSQHRTMDMYDLSEFEEFVVYISYTDKMSDWVRNELKPLIESLHSVVQVDIHENSMIPGFSVSAERQRLILGADKIIIIVSTDYSTSEWCGYELEHAIHQKPSLRNGRVIPILTEDMNTLPRIIEGVVCLHKNQTDFQARLEQAILKKPMI